MADYLEAFVTLLPADAGGRGSAIEPRAGTYRACARVAGSEAAMAIRFIEGPPRLMPGQDALVVIEIERALGSALLAGEEIEIVEEMRVVGIAYVLRHWPAALSAV
jgi:hypothetical protein